MGNITLTMIKPTAVKNGHTGEILAMIIKAGFRIKAMKMLKLSVAEAETFYQIHKGKDFYDKLIKFMTSGPIVAAVLEKENAFSDYRKLIGPTNFEEAEEGTIRKAFATSINQNAVHGSDSDENAIIESNFFFSSKEMF